MAEPSRPREVLRRVGSWSLALAGAAALYLLLIDTTDLPELLVGAGMAALAATGFQLARERGVTPLVSRLRWLKRAYRPLLKVPSDVVVLSRLALRQLVAPRAGIGEFRAVPFRCGDDAALETGRRAVAESLGSFAPNTIIVGVDPDRELLVGHQLHVSGGAEAIDVLGLG